MRLHKIHRALGITSAVFIIYLSVTGLLLNHSHRLELDRTPVANNWILDIYGIDTPDNIPAFAVGEDWVVYWDETVYYNDKRVAHSTYPVIGALQTSTFTILATTEEIWLLTIDGELVEKLTSPGVKLGDILRLGLQDDRVIVETASGLHRADHDLVAWESISDRKISWSTPVKLPQQMLVSLSTQLHSISMERFLLDLHSGRLLGDAGIILIDLVAILLIILSISGMLMWYKRRKRFR